VIVGEPACGVEGDRTGHGWLDDPPKLFRKTTNTRADAPAIRAMIPAE
jgi:hypothetical protein